MARLASDGFGNPVFTATLGETNNVVLTFTSGQNLRISDTNPITLMGSACDHTDVNNVVECRGLVGPFGARPVSVNLDDRDDSLTTGNTAPFPVIAEGGSGNDSIVGGPAGSNWNTSDTLNGGAGDDLISGGGGSNTQTGGDLISGGDGADILVGGDGPETIHGDMGNDTLSGGTGNDSLDGGYGGDGMNGEAGKDTLQGGAGPDVYIGGDDDDRLLAGYDNDDFQGGNGFDTVDYTGWNSIDTGCFPDPCPIGVDVTIDNQPNDGDYDLDGDGVTQGAADNVHDDVESVVGTAVADTMNGGPLARDQIFTGAAGDDSIIGGPGNDTVTGLNHGNWTLTDTALTGAGADTLSGIEAANLESVVTAASTAFTLDASGFSGQAKMTGGMGDDTLIGGNGSDILNGNAGTDRVIATADGAHPSITLTNGTMIGRGSDSLSSFEKATLMGDAGNSTLDASGFSGPGTLDGGAGIDTLLSGSGSDTLTGGPGNDIVNGGPGSDRLVESGDANFTLTNSGLASPATGTDSLASVELATLTGGMGANALDASLFTGAVTLSGGVGDDTLTAGAGGDTLNGGDDADTLNGGGDADTLNGDDGTDALTGGPAADTLNGGASDDTLDGGSDSDNDVLDGDAGTNQVVATGDTNFTLTNTNLIGNGNDSLSDIQRATLAGGPGDNALNASGFTLGGVDLDGMAGKDTLLGGSGPDLLTGGSGEDSFDAGADGDTVRAGDGVAETSIVCGAGSDTATADAADVVNADCEAVDVPPLQHTLAVTKSGSGTGTVTSSSAGIDCGATCSAQFDEGKAVTLTATPGAGSSFAGWSGGCSGTGGCQVTMDADKSVTAMFSASTADTELTRARISQAKRSATFWFQAAGSATGFECAVSKRVAPEFEPCDSPSQYKHLRPGRYTFKVRADWPGGTDDTPAKKKFKIKP